MKNLGRKFTIGRDGSCDVRIADDSVSRVHAELTMLEDGSLILRDCGSSNGTQLLRQGMLRNLFRETVRDSDRIKFGDAEVSVADLIEVIQKKPPVEAPAIASSLKPGQAPANAAGKGHAIGKPGKLVRCDCGTIKPVGKSCPECGQ